MVLLIESRGTGLNPLDAIVYYQFVQAFSNQVKFSAHHVTTTLNVPFVTYRKEKKLSFFLYIWKHESLADVVHYLEVCDI